MNTTARIAIMLLWAISVFPAHAQFAVDVETGMAFPGYNDVRIPGKGGTTFSLTEDLTSASTLFVRGRAQYTFAARHTLSVLIAPLTINATGQIGKDIVFQDKTFSSNTPLEAKWKFNSYRLTYRYDFAKNDDVEFGLGLTGKIRDAEIRLSGGGQVSSKTDLGFVPLINVRLLWNVASRVGLLVEGDALAAPQGRAEDITAALVFRPSDTVMLRAGYRILEGGADNDEVYNFALVHYAALGVTVTF